MQKKNSKSDFEQMNYKTLIIEMIGKMDNENHLKYIYILIKTLLD